MEPKTANEANRKVRPLFISAIDVLNRKTVEHPFLIEKIMPGGVINLLSGTSDVGKSLLARQIAVGVALGKEKILGHKTNLRHQKAIYITTEDADWNWKQRLTTYDLSVEERKKLKNLKLVFDYDQFTPDALTKQLKQEQVDLVVVDVLTDLYGKDLNSGSEVRNFLTPYKKIARDFSTGFLFIHHISKKADAEGAASKANVLGSQAIEASMRNVMELKHGGDVDSRLLYITKGNYLSAQDKKLPFKLHLLPTLDFEYRGEKGTVSQAKIDSRNSMVIALHKQGLSLRKIEAAMKKDGVAIGRTTIANVVAEYNDLKEAA